MDTQRVSRSRPSAICPSRSGLSLIEVLVAISIVGVLMALLFPAIQAQRETARRLACRNNLRQIGVALQSHQTARGYYPRGGYMRFDGTAGGGHGRYHAPHIYLLPYLGRGDIYDLIDLEAQTGTGHQEVQQLPVPVFHCPSDSNATSVRNNYRANLGLSLYPDTDSALTQTPSFGDGAFAPAVRSLYPQHYPDGLSNTVAFSERLTGDVDTSEYAPVRDYFILQAVADSGDVFASPDAPWKLIAACGSLTNPAPLHISHVGTNWFKPGLHHTLYNHLLTPNHPIPDCGVNADHFGWGLMTARSVHSGGVNSLLMDGSVRFVSDSIDHSVWHAVGTRNGKELSNF